MNNCKVKTLVVMLVLFAMGAVSGWFAGRYDCEGRVERRKSKEELTDIVLKKFGQFGLTREQLVEIRPLVEAASERQVQSQDEHWNETMANFRGMKDKIKPVLTPKQIETIEQAFRDVEKQRKGR